jgi:hypothetical protein
LPEVVKLMYPDVRLKPLYTARGVSSNASGSARSL